MFSVHMAHLITSYLNSTELNCIGWGSTPDSAQEGHILRADVYRPVVMYLGMTTCTRPPRVLRIIHLPSARRTGAFAAGIGDNTGNVNTCGVAISDAAFCQIRLDTCLFTI